VSVTDVCVVAVSCARVSGAWVTAVAGQGPDFVMCVTDPVSEQLAELQLTLGEGPCHDVLASAAPVLAGGLADDHARQWPAFAPEAGQFGARAVFAFPLAVGAILAGTMGLYRDSPGPLTRAQLGDTLLLADSTTALLIDSTGHDSAETARGPGPDGQAPDLAAHRAEVDQATGMLILQLGATITGRSPGSALTPMPGTGGSPTWPPTSSPDACDCTPTPTQTPTRLRAPGHDAIRQPAGSSGQ